MGIHDSYGKGVLNLATNKQFEHWFADTQLSFEYPSGGIIAKLDGIIGDECVVEVQGLNEKQIRGGILDLVLHPRSKKLLVTVPANVGKKSNDSIQHAYQGLLDYLITVCRPAAIGQVVVLTGTGNEPEDYLRADSSAIRRALKLLNVSV